jgi:hypothetical protein
MIAAYCLALLVLLAWAIDAGLLDWLGEVVDASLAPTDEADR